MRRWFDSLFGRVLLVQGLVALMVMLLFGVVALRQQSMALARATAPIWATALLPPATPAAPSEPASTLPRNERVTTTVQLLAGPPPTDAVTTRWYPRFHALAAELRAVGVPVVSMRVSGTTGAAVTWLELESAGQLSWVGIRGELEGTDLRERGSLGLLAGALGTLLAAWWLSHRLVRPLTELKLAMRRFALDGRPPGPASASAPAELRELALQFAELARKRQALDEQRRTMLAAISHDLRSPLGRIRMAAELLPEGADVDKRREAIVRNVQLADRLLGSFIEMARADDEPLHDRVDLAAMLRQVLDDDDRFVAQIPEQPVWLQPASALGLERALRNVLDNARHHGAAPFEVQLGAQASQAVLTVRDHGAGIAAAEREKMLQPFVRGETSRQRPGTGLGLAIVQRTVHRHQGRLTLEDAAPGLRVRIELPSLEHQGTAPPPGFMGA